jgi:hypothetical protein
MMLRRQSRMQAKRRTGVGLHGLGSCRRDGQGVGDVRWQQLQEIGHAGDTPLGIGVLFRERPRELRVALLELLCGARIAREGVTREHGEALGKRSVRVYHDHEESFRREAGEVDAGGLMPRLGFARPNPL